MILADTSIEGACALAENIRNEIEELNIKNEGSPSDNRVTIIFGVAVSPPGGQISKDELIRSADESLYKAKDYGRNKVVSS